MHWEVYLLTKHGWNCGKSQEKKAGKPRLAYENHAMPVFYRDVMYREEKEGKDEAYLKLYDGHDWKWFCVRLNHTDMEYLRRNWSGKKASAPTLEKRHHKYFLRFSYTEEVTLTKTPVKEQIICSVDLGINTDAVCTIMRADGTVLGRKFINHPSEKRPDVPHTGPNPKIPEGTQLCAVTGKMGIYETPEHRAGKKNCRCDRKNAEENHADVIVFEYLEMQGKISGKKNRNCICGENGISRNAVSIRHTEKECGYPESAHGIRAGLHTMAPEVCPVTRKSQSLCIPDRKRYNCDLSASYNIGARYFIREL